MKVKTLSRLVIDLPVSDRAKLQRPFENVEAARERRHLLRCQLLAALAHYGVGDYLINTCAVTCLRAAPLLCINYEGDQSVSNKSFFTGQPRRNPQRF